jgi:hypothetical protein
MGMLPISAGEIYWLRLLLYKLPAYSYLELRTVGDITCPSFQQAAILRNLIDDIAVAREMFLECLIHSTPHELRVLFALFTNMTLQGFPTMAIYMDDVLHRAMQDDFVNQQHQTESMATNKLLLQLAKLFKSQSNKLLSDYGFPEPQDQDTELQMKRVSYGPDDQLKLASLLLISNPLTGEMKKLFDDICRAIESKERFVGILQGIAGSGKSTFVKYLMAHIRSKGHIAKGCASTGLAASVYDDFVTAHSLFKIPVIDDEEEFDQESDFKCTLDNVINAERAEVIHNMTFCAWDECSSQHMRDIRAAIAAVNNFEGKVLLLIGDALQITPVVKGGSKSAICASSIYCSELMQQAKYYQFTKILRLQNIEGDPSQAKYAQLIRCISTNTLPDSDTITVPPFQVGCDYGEIEGVLKLYIPDLQPLFHSVDAVNFCYPGGFDTNIMHESCILAATNKQVDNWNAEVQELNPQPVWNLMSQDSIDTCDDPNNFIAKMVTQEVLNQYEDPSASPPHELKLKINDICILMRAVSKPDKLATNTRVRIFGISTNIVRVSTLQTTPMYANLPRFVFKLKMPYGKSFEVNRRQFPLRLAYSLSINRSQGQTLDKVVVDLTQPCFMHGHLNVALSRIRKLSNIAIYVHETNYDQANNMIITTNVVYPEILAALQR